MAGCDNDIPHLALFGVPENLFIYYSKEEVKGKANSTVWKQLFSDEFMATQRQEVSSS